MSTWSFQQMSDATLERLSRASHAKMYPSPDPFTKGKTETPLRKLLLVSRLWNAVRRHQSYRAWSSPPMLSPPTMPQQLPQSEELPSSDAMPQDLEFMLQTANGFKEVVAEQDPGFYIPPPIAQAPVVGQEGVFSLHSIPSPSDPVMDVSGMSTHGQQNQSPGPEILFIQEYPGQEDYYLLPQNSSMPADDKQQQQLGGLGPTTADLSQLFNVATMTANGDGMTTTTAAAMLSQPGLGLIAAVPLGTSPPTPTTLLDHSQIVFQIPVDNPQRSSSMSSSLSNYNTLSVQSAVAATPPATPAALVNQERDLDSVTNNAVEEASSAVLDDEDVEEKSSLNNATSCTDAYTASSAQDTATVMAKDVVEAMPKKRSVDDVDGYHVSEKPAKRASPTKEKDNGATHRNIVSSYSLRSKRKSSNGSGSVSPSKQQTARNTSVTVAPSLASTSEPSQAQVAATATTPPPAGADVAKRIERGIERLSLEPEPHTDDLHVLSADSYDKLDDYDNASARKRRIDDVDDQAVPDKLPKSPSPAYDLQGDNIGGPGAAAAAAAAAARVTSSYSLRSRNRSSAAPAISPAKQSRNADFTDPSPPPSPAPHIAIPTLQRRPSSPLAIEEPTIPRAIDISYREHTSRRSPATASAARRNSESSGNGSSAGGSTGGSPPSPGPASPGPVLISA